MLVLAISELKKNDVHSQSNQRILNRQRPFFDGRFYIRFRTLLCQTDQQS